MAKPKPPLPSSTACRLLGWGIPDLDQVSTNVQFCASPWVLCLVLVHWPRSGSEGVEWSGRPWTRAIPTGGLSMSNEQGAAYAGASARSTSPILETTVSWDAWMVSVCCSGQGPAPSCPDRSGVVSWPDQKVLALCQVAMTFVFRDASGSSSGS